MTPVDSYNAQANFGEVVKGVENSKSLGVTDQCLLLYGNGDGGGGPTSGMLEKVGDETSSPAKLAYVLAASASAIGCWLQPRDALCRCWKGL